MRAIKEEAFKVAIAMLLGGNKRCQDKFHDFISNDQENFFMIQLKEQMTESFDRIKRIQIKRNMRLLKIEGYN